MKPLNLQLTIVTKLRKNTKDNDKLSEVQRKQLIKMILMQLMSVLNPMLPKAKCSKPRKMNSWEVLMMI
jgi:hypothetical protein